VQRVEKAACFLDPLAQLQQGVGDGHRIVRVLLAPASAPSLGGRDEILQLVEFVQQKCLEQARLRDVSRVGGALAATRGGVRCADRHDRGAVQRVVARVHGLQRGDPTPSGFGAC
jgi:hypothetical protein